MRVWDWNGTEWHQIGSDIEGEEGGEGLGFGGDSSGESVSMSNDGTRVAIGANKNDDNGDGSGHVRVYQLPEP